MDDRRDLGGQGVALRLGESKVLGVRVGGVGDDLGGLLLCQGELALSERVLDTRKGDFV